MCCQCVVMFSRLAVNCWAFGQDLHYSFREPTLTDRQTEQRAAGIGATGQGRRWLLLNGLRPQKMLSWRRRASPSSTESRLEILRCKRALLLDRCHSNEEASSGGLDSSRPRLTTVSYAAKQPRHPAITASTNESFGSARLPRGLGGPRAACLRPRPRDFGGLRGEADAPGRDDGKRALYRRSFPWM